MDTVEKGDTEVLRISRKQTIAALFTVLSALLAIISVLIIAIASHIFEQIDRDAERISALELKAAKSERKHAECKENIMGLIEISSAYRTADEKRMGLLDLKLNTVESDCRHNGQFIKRCCEQIKRGQ